MLHQTRSSYEGTRAIPLSRPLRPGSHGPSQCPAEAPLRCRRGNRTPAARAVGCGSQSASMSRPRHTMHATDTLLPTVWKDNTHHAAVRGLQGCVTPCMPLTPYYQQSGKIIHMMRKRDACKAASYRARHWRLIIESLEENTHHAELRCGVEAGDDSAHQLAHGYPQRCLPTLARERHQILPMSNTYVHPFVSSQSLARPMQKQYQHAHVPIHDFANMEVHTPWRGPV